MRRWREQRWRKGGAEKTKGRGIVKSNRGERPGDKRMDRMWQWRDIQLQDCERCRRSSLLLIAAVEEIVYACEVCVCEVCVCLSDTHLRTLNLHFTTLQDHNMR